MPRLPPSTLPVAALVLMLDQACKALVAGWELGASRVIAPGLLRVVHVRNADGALGLLGDLPTDVRLLVFGLATGGLFGAGLAFSDRARGPAIGTGLGLILGGACGNTVDRAVRGAVVDLLVLAEGLYPVTLATRLLGLPGPPAFNLADLAIAAGVALLAASVARRVLRPGRRAVAAPGPAR